VISGRWSVVSKVSFCFQLITDHWLL